MTDHCRIKHPVKKRCREKEGISRCAKRKKLIQTTKKFITNIQDANAVETVTTDSFMKRIKSKSTGTNIQRLIV